MVLVDDVATLLNTSKDAAAVLDLPAFDDFASLAGVLLGSVCGNAKIAAIVQEIYSKHQPLAAISEYDITQTAERNYEPGGAAATLLFSRGAQAILAHRVAHQVWCDGNTNKALALKAAFGRAFSTDIHPAAKIGAGLWLDHGLGFVVGETAVIEDDVSIWHNVTLGSTLNDDGPNRHPKIERGAVIGAGAMLLGNINIGAGANIAAGAIVVSNVPAQRTAIGYKAKVLGTANVSFEANKGEGS